MAIDQVFKPSQNQISTFISVVCVSIMSSFTYTCNHRMKLSKFRHIFWLNQTCLFYLESVMWWVNCYNSSFLTISKSDFNFYYFTFCLKMSSFTNTWNHQKHISIFGYILFLLESILWWICGYNSSLLTISNHDLNFH